MIIHRGYRFKLYPTAEQEVLFQQHAGVCRLVYNLALEQRRTWGRSHGIGYMKQARELTALRAQFSWIADVTQTCQQQALRDLDVAFVSFFSGRKGYPRPRKKGENDSFRFVGREVRVRTLNRKWSLVRLSKIGWVKFRDTRALRGRIIRATVSRDAIGWHVSIGCEIDHQVACRDRPSVGIDRGVANTITLSTGEAFSVPSRLDDIDRRHRAAQRVVARRKIGSKRRTLAVKRCARLAAKRARIRRDWQHRVSRTIADRFGVVVMEDLRITNMTASARGTVDEPGRRVRQKSGLNRSILNQGWGGLATILDYKLEERGGSLVTVDPAYTSQTCSGCGAVDNRSRESQAVFLCRHCGFRAHADHNAAINILRRNTASMDVEGGISLPVKRQPGSGESLSKTSRCEARGDVDRSLPVVAGASGLV